MFADNTVLLAESEEELKLNVEMRDKEVKTESLLE